MANSYPRCRKGGVEQHPRFGHLEPVRIHCDRHWRGKHRRGFCTRGYVYTLNTTGGWVRQYISTQAITIDFRQVPMNTGISISIAICGGDDCSQAVGSREVLLATGDSSAFNPSSNMLTLADVPMRQVLRELKPMSRYNKPAVAIGQDSREADSAAELRAWHVGISRHALSVLELLDAVQQRRAG